MSNISSGTISGMNAIPEIINSTVKKIDIADVNDPQPIIMENTVHTSNFNAEVQVKQVYDNYNDFLTEEMHKTQAEIETDSSMINQMTKLEDLLCEKSSIFSSLITDLHNQIEKDVILNQNTEVNEGIEKKIYDVVMSLKDFNRKLNFLETDNKAVIEKNINALNLIIDHIQIVNKELSHISFENSPDQVTSLLDKRESLVEDLNHIMAVKVVKIENDYKILLHDDIVLIDNNSKQNLSIIKSESDPKYISIGYKDKYHKHSTIENIENFIFNGTLRALFKFRDEELNRVRNKIGQLTINFGRSINSYHMLGYDQYGEIGTQFLNLTNPSIIANTSHKRSAIWDDIYQVKDSDYQVFFQNNQWKVTRLSDNVSITPMDLDLRRELSFTSFSFDGIIFNVDGKAHEGDSYKIKTYSQTLDRLKLLIDKEYTAEPFESTDPKEIQNNHDFHVYQFNQDLLVNNGETFDDAYQNFAKDIIYRRRILEDGIPFKRKLLYVLEDKKMSIDKDIDQDYETLNFQQKCYMANSKVLKTAEKILHDIIDAYR